MIEGVKSKAMFTGIISDLGSVRAIRQAGDARYEFNTSYDTGTIDIGASIACSGACLTVIDKGPGWFSVEVSRETLSKTTLGDWRVESLVNFERPLKAADELGGHLVSGHVDGVGVISDLSEDGDSIRLSVETPDELMPFIAVKGSISIDGISLTVNDVGAQTFGVNIIPHTQNVTNLQAAKIGTRVNLEIDLLARYVARLLNKD